MAVTAGIEVAVDQLDVTTCTIPTDEPDSDRAAEWDSTTVFIVEAHAGGEIGLGYTYAPAATATLICEMLADVVEGRDAFAVTRSWRAMAKTLRKAGRPGVGSEAMAAVDTALWDLKRPRLFGSDSCEGL